MGSDQLGGSPESRFWVPQPPRSPDRRPLACSYHFSSWIRGVPWRGSRVAGFSQLARKYFDIYRSSSVIQLCSYKVSCVKMHASAGICGCTQSRKPEWWAATSGASGCPEAVPAEADLWPGALSVPRTLTPPLEGADWVLGLFLSQRPLQENKLSVLRGGGNSSLFKNRRGSLVAMTNFSCFSVFLKNFYFFFLTHIKRYIRLPVKLHEKIFILCPVRVRFKGLWAKRACVKAFEGSWIFDILGTHPTPLLTSTCPYRYHYTYVFLIKKKIPEKMLKK